MARSLLRKVPEPAVFVPEVAKQHDVFVRAIASGGFRSTVVLVDEIVRKLFECFNEDLPMLARVPPTVMWALKGQLHGSAHVQAII